ncbi:MAG: leucine-rich repeat domain-containing protein, partial [Ruminococcus sp.]|nr:leucine-rich repeat domain-containing protein [Ruminococcus sp.]
MKKRLLSAALAVCMLFGSAAALPEGFLGESTVITASAEMNTSFYQLSDGTYRLKTCTGTDTSVTLPTEYNGKAVTDVGGVKSGGLDSGISVFSRLGAPNTTLTQLVVPSSYKKLSASAFADCTALKSVTLSTGLVKIGDNVFGSDTALTSITIPSTITSIASNAFNGCTALNSITVASGSTAFASVDGVLYNAAKTSLVAVPAAKTSIDIPG